ncbi:MAG: 4-(cytidine 5'-diphospho)-2-C-methyl-D-erythritol kinase [Nitrospiraceae bacterium]
MPSKEGATNFGLISAGTPETIPSSSRRVSVAAPAKINLILKILDRRPDEYHNLWSVMQTVDLKDEIVLDVGSRPGRIDLTCDQADVPSGPDNLVCRAAALVLERARLAHGLAIELRKRIPMGAGLGGGSSDAAATILGLNRLFDLGWSPREMAEVGGLLGSDVPFFFFAPCAKVSGRGDHVSPLKLIGRRAVLLVNPGFGVETKWAYRTLAATRTVTPVLGSAVMELDRQASISWEELRPLMGNDFEDVVFPYHPVLLEIKEALFSHGAESAFLSGTGATVFGIFESISAATQAGRVFAERPGWRTVAAETEARPLSVTLGGA